MNCLKLLKKSPKSGFNKRGFNKSSPHGSGGLIKAFRRKISTDFFVTKVILFVPFDESITDSKFLTSSVN